MTDRKCECGHEMHRDECQHCDCSRPAEDRDAPTAENWRRLELDLAESGE